MDTTCGSFALKGAKASKNAATVDLLVEAGMIIIAKTNLSVSISNASHESISILTTMLSGLGGMKGALMTAV